MPQPYGLLLVGFNYSNIAEDEFHDWYDTEHIPDRVRIKGVFNARRWLGADDPKIAVAVYDLESLAVRQTPEYRAISGANATPWSKRVTPKCQRLCAFEADQILPGQQTAPDEAQGLVMFATNIAPEAEAEFNAWYNDEHIPRLTSVAGCLCARRFRMAGGTHRYLALCHLSSPEVQASPAWKEAVNTPQAAKMRAHFRDPLRMVLRRYQRRNP